MIGALGEILGAIGVIATLGYLAKQVKSYAQSSRQSNEREMIEGSRLILNELATDAELIKVFRIGMADYEKLDSDQEAQFRALLLQMAFEWDRIYHFGLEGDASSWIVESNRRMRNEIIHGRGFQIWFASRKHLLSDEFRQEVENVIAEGGTYKPFGLPQSS